MWPEVLIRLINMTCHLVLLAIIEPTFFFSFAATSEIKKHKHNVQVMSEKIQHLLCQLEDHTQEIGSPVSHEWFALNIRPIVDDVLQNEAQQAKHNRHQFNHNLIFQSIIFMFCVLVAFLCLAGLAYFYHISVPWKTIITDNLFILVGIAIFEFYFYYHVASQYQTGTNEEDLFRYIQVIWKNIQDLKNGKNTCVKNEK